MVHSDLCARAECARGHYVIARSFADGLALADPTVQLEVGGFTDTSQRPADIYSTAAVSGCSAALDVTVISPEAASAPAYLSIIQQVHRAGIVFRPLFWTTDGRPHPAVVRTMRYATKLAARRNGTQTAGEIHSSGGPTQEGCIEPACLRCPPRRAGSSTAEVQKSCRETS
jgi:hypothetical protein